MSATNNTARPRFFNTIKLFALLLFIPGNIFSQVRLSPSPDRSFSTYFLQKASFAKSLPETKGDIVFIGNSITDGAIWSELFNDIHVKSRGFSGDVTAGVIKRFGDIVRRKPAKIFMMIGTNDLAGGISPDSVVKNIFLMADYLQQESPATKLYIESILPVNDVFGKFPTHTKNSSKINTVNQLLESGSRSHHFRYIDLHDHFADQNGKMDTRYTNDGLHLLGPGYALWKHLIYRYVYDLNEKPSIIPMPQFLKWEDGNFPLYGCKYILIKNKSLQNAAELLQQKIEAAGWHPEILNQISDRAPYIELSIQQVNSPQLSEEAYSIKVGNDKISVTANTTHGIFNAIQTFEQLMRDGELIDDCEIHDWPAFSWRGFMVDVGRNFETTNMLKQEIDKMAFYKLNIFHFHFTEDIAWRLQSKSYPQLTAPENMLRDKGEYYREADMKELIRYCKERYITLVPEIDMPGHSGAFKRAMHTDMQSDSGITILKNILKEFCGTYDLPYFHIGGDEVKIQNKKFIPEITKYLSGFGKKVIGWEPGAHYLQGTMLQLWKGDTSVLKRDKNTQYIDSRHLYLNHMDPLEAPVTIFFRQIGDVVKEDKNMKGGTLCLWPDRRVDDKKKILLENPVYPGMIAFAERTWRGGGIPGWITNVETENQEQEFAAFEQRLLDHKVQYFQKIPFPYHRQMMMHWDLYGPYKNGGDLLQPFLPETTDFGDSPSVKATGGTIVLRHWWYPLVRGVIENPSDNTTWYATTKIWSDEEKVGDFWIGFNDLSRSPATDSPEAGTWDELKSKVWVNGKIVAPPTWDRPGQKGNSEIPLMDEGYSYREPAKILLKKGWNDVLIKAPVGSFKGKDWQNPVKWEFTFSQISRQ